MTIVFYDYKMAPSPRRTRIMLAEKGVPHEAVEVDMMKAEQLSDSYRAINPNCTIPALKLDGGEVLTDTAGITVYLEETYPEPALMGVSTMDKVEIASWSSQIENELGAAIPNALRNTNLGMKDRALPGPVNYKQIPKLAERGSRQIDAFMTKLEQRLEGRDFIAAEQLSVADITTVCFLDFAGGRLWRPPQQLCGIAVLRADRVEWPRIGRLFFLYSETRLQRLLNSRQIPQLRWVQAANDHGAVANALPAGIDEDVREVLVDQIAQSREVMSELMGCDQVGIRLETLSAPMCPRFHVDHVPCRMLITLSGTGTEWIHNSDVDWAVFADLKTSAPPLQAHKEIQSLTTGNWSLLKGGAWKNGFEGVVHRSPHSGADRLLLSLDPIMQARDE